MRSILNISSYKFVSLSDAAGWRESVYSRAAASNLKGTVLIAGEGINLFVAGVEPYVREMMKWLTSFEMFADMAVKESWSDHMPFRRLIVKVKPEIIRMNHPLIQPQKMRAPAVDATTLSRWLTAGMDDTGRQVVMLDTRNAFEVDQGRFKAAMDWRLSKFSDFPTALKENVAMLEGKTVVSYCTGGIRCEKAALLMQEAGFENVLQLDGGILRYFEEVGGRHFEGDCFVFDDREALSDTLAPVASV